MVASAKSCLLSQARGLAEAYETDQFISSQRIYIYMGSFPHRVIGD